MRDALTRLAILHGTDKFGYHDYTPNYFEILQHLSERPIKLLEIGVGGYADDDRGGQSLKVWRDFFPQGQITGIDIQKKTMDLGPRVQILQGSQVDPEFLEQIVRDRGPFDVIIDDGSHRNEHIIESYRLLFPNLVPGGIYIAEDVQTSFHPRFGGSLALTAPNSVGHFSHLMALMNAGSDDPLIRDIAAIERYHNMIVVHKQPQSGAVRNVFTSQHVQNLAGREIALAVIGDDTFSPDTLPFGAAVTHHHSWSNAGTSRAADLIVARLKTADAQPKTSELDMLLDGLNDGGCLIVHTDDPRAHLVQDSVLLDHARHRFTMIDHVEIKVHFPDAEIDDLAPQIYGIQRYPDALLYVKSPNCFPSNFAYDAQNPQAQAVLTHMGEVLQDATSEGGLMQYAGLLTRHFSREAARDILMRLTDLGANSREYFQLAGNLARSDGRLEDAEQIFSKALNKFPLDPQFSVALANVAVACADPKRAEQLLRDSYASFPRARVVVAQLSRLCMINGKMDEAIELGQKSIKMFPHMARPQRLKILAQLLEKAGRKDEAKTALDEADRLALANEGPVRR